MTDLDEIRRRYRAQKNGPTHAQRMSSVRHKLKGAATRAKIEPLVGTGLTPKEIAERVGVSPSHVRAVIRRFKRG